MAPERSRSHSQNFNFFKDALLDGPDLFETNQLQKREKSYHHFYARNEGSKQIGKTEPIATGNALQNRIDLLRNTETFAKNFLYVLSRFDPFHYRLERVDELKNSNFA